MEKLRIDPIEAIACWPKTISTPAGPRSSTASEIFDPCVPLNSSRRDAANSVRSAPDDKTLSPDEVTVVLSEPVPSVSPFHSTLQRWITQIIRESSGGATPAFAADSNASARKIPCAMVEVDSRARAA